MRYTRLEKYILVFLSAFVFLACTPNSETSVKEGITCCIKAINNGRGHDSIMVEVELKNGEVVLAEWPRGVVVKKNKAVKIEYTNQTLTGLWVYKFITYI